MSDPVKHKGKFVVIPGGDWHGVYELTRTLPDTKPPEQPATQRCACCALPMIPIFDVVQQGFWEDSFETYFACLSCRKAIVFTYTLSRIEPTKGKKGKKAAK